MSSPLERAQRRIAFVAACGASSLAFAQEPVVVEVEDDGPTLAERVAALEEKMPFDVSVYATTSYQALTGSRSDSDYLTGYLDMFAEGELWAGTTAVLEFESMGGDGPDVDVPSFGSLWYGWNANAGSSQDDEGFDHVLLGEAYVSTDALGRGWILDAGKLSSVSYLDTVRVANDSTAQFLSAAFANSLAFEAPWRGAGVALTYAGSEHFDARLLAMRSDNSGEDATHELFFGAQLDAFWGADALPGNAALFAWNNRDRDDQAGLGLNVDQDMNEHSTAFLRVGWQEEESSLPQAIDSAWSVGFELRGSAWNEERDVLGLALGSCKSHDSTLDDERQFEAYFKRAFNAHCEVSLHLQHFQHPAGDPNEDGVAALGARVLLML